MWIIIYAAGGATTATLLLVAFLRDKQTPLTCYRSWLLLVVASVTWPISLLLAGLERWNAGHSELSVIGEETQEPAQVSQRNSTPNAK